MLSLDDPITRTFLWGAGNYGHDIRSRPKRSEKDRSLTTTKQFLLEIGAQLPIESCRVGTWRTFNFSDT